MRTPQSLSTTGAFLIFTCAIGCGSASSGSDPDAAAPSDAAGSRDDTGSRKDAAPATDAHNAQDSGKQSLEATTPLPDAGTLPSDATVVGPNGEASTDAGTLPHDSSAATPGVPVNLGTAADYVVLAETGISTVTPSMITGDLGISPAAATYITGFSLIAGTGNVYSTSAQVTGKVYAADYAVPTPTNLTTAIGDMKAAFTAAAGRAADVTGLGAGSIGGMNLHEGVYRWGTDLLLATDVTLSGSATDVWIFQVAGDLTVSNGAHLVLAGGALPKNIFWQVSGKATLGTTVELEGTLLCQTGIALGTGTTVTGRLLAQTAVTLNANTVIAPP